MSREFYHALGRTETWPNITAANPSSLTYDDVTLLPRADTAVETRRQVDTSVQFGPFMLQIPLVSAPMDTASGERMIRALAARGGIGTLPRGHLRENLALCERFSKEGISVIYAIGLHDAFNTAKKFHERGAQMILVDAAHGGMRKMGYAAAEIQDKLDMWTIAGNIATYEQAQWYKQLGIRIARVGVGNGGVCITRLVTGAGVPQLSAIFETTENGLFVIADGGIWYGGDLAKALAAGAKVGMLGSRLGGTDEAPGELRDGKKIVRGQASPSYMGDWGIEMNDSRPAEGIEVEVSYTGPVNTVLDEIIGGLRSSMSYADARTLEEFYEKSIFVYNSESARAEGRPHLAMR